MILAVLELCHAVKSLLYLMNKHISVGMATNGHSQYWYSEQCWNIITDDTIWEMHFLCGNGACQYFLFNLNHLLWTMKFIALAECWTLIKLICKVYKELFTKITKIGYLCKVGICSMYRKAGGILLWIMVCYSLCQEMYSW